jgi:hypothetical protein
MVNSMSLRWSGERLQDDLSAVPVLCVTHFRFLPDEAARRIRRRGEDVRRNNRQLHQ